MRAIGPQGVPRKGRSKLPAFMEGTMKGGMSDYSRGEWQLNKFALTQPLMLLLLVMLGGVSPATLLADVVAGPRIPIATGPNPEYVASSEISTPVAYDPGNRRFLAAWIEEQPDDENPPSYIRTSLLLRFVERDGALAGSAIVFRPYDNHQIQENPHVVFDPQAGGYFAVWLEWGYQEDWVGTYCQFIGRDGASLGQPLRITPADEKFTPVALLLNPVDRRFLVLLQHGTPTGPQNLFGQFITAEGVPDGDRFQITNHTNPYTVAYPAAAFDPEIQKYLVAYRSEYFNQIRGRFIRADGALEGNELVIYSQGRIPDCVINDPLHHRFLVLLRAYRDNPDAVLLKADGSPLTSFRLCRSSPNVSYGMTYKGGFDTLLQKYLVVWNDGPIYGQLVSADGQKEGTSGALHHNPEVASPVAGFALAPPPARALVTWGEWPNEDSNYYGLIAKPSGMADSLPLLLLAD